MKSSESLARRSELVRHKHEMQRLRDKHKAEVEGMQTSHKINKSNVKNNHILDVANLKSSNDLKLIEKSEANKKVLEKLDSSIQTVQNRIEKEKRELISTHDSQKADQQIQHEIGYTNKKERNTLALQDLEQQAQIDIQKMQREFARSKQDIAEVSRKDINDQKEIAVKKKTVAKDLYYNDQVRQQDKFARALHNKNVENKKQMSQTERTHQSKLKLKNELYNEVLTELDKDGREKIATNQKRFEEDFNRLFAKQEGDLQTLIGKKEVLIQQLKEDLVNEYKLGVEKNKDPFYSFGSLKVQVSEGQKQDYDIKIPIAPHEANKIRLTGHSRELKIEMERRYEFQKSSESGSKNSINKVESYVTKLPVKDIIDPKTVTRSYADGVLTFNIKKA